MSGRYLEDGKLNIAGRWKSPGPGKYMPPSCIGFQNHDPTIAKRPAYTIGFKHRDPAQEFNSPGPIYLPNPKVLTTGKESTPKPHIVSRPKEYGLWTGPGPNQYYPMNSAKPSSPAFTIGSKHKHLEVPCHPVGPNQYSLPNTIGNNNFCTFVKTAPKFSLSSRNKFMSTTFGLEDNTNHSLYVIDVDRVKKSAPRWTISGRHYAPDSNCLSQTPGPSSYRPETVKLTVRNQPKFSFGSRHSEYCSTFY